MTRFLSETACSNLSLQGEGRLEKGLDWVTIWESWASEGPSVFLESAGVSSAASEWLILAGMPENEYFENEGKCWWADASGFHQVRFDFWDFADSIGNGKDDYLPLPFSLSSSWFGALSYEFGFHTQMGTKRTSQSYSKTVPDFYFFKPSFLIAANRCSKEYFLFGRKAFDPFQEVSRRRIPLSVQPIQARWTSEDYRLKVESAKAYIQSGDIYQANLSQSFQTQWEGNVGSLYRLLREMNPGPFMGIFKGRNFTVVSSSPERLVSGEGNLIETRPIAGTRPGEKMKLRTCNYRWSLKRIRRSRRNISCLWIWRGMIWDGWPVMEPSGSSAMGR